MFYYIMYENTMINLTTAKKLDKIFNVSPYVSIVRDYTIEKLLQKLPVCVTTEHSKRDCYLEISRGRSGWYSVAYIDCYGSYFFKEVIHKNLAEALARLLIKLTEEKLI